MHTDASGRWVSDDGAWFWDPATDRWLRRTPPTPPPSEVVVPPPPPGEMAATPATGGVGTVSPPAREVAGPLPVPGAAAMPPSEGGQLSDVGLPDAARTGELPPVASLVLDPTSADRSGTSSEIGPGLPTGARPAARPGAGEDRLTTLLTPRFLTVMGAVLALVVVLVLVLARGGGGGRAARPASTTTAASPAAYPATAQRAYLDACVASTPDGRSFCDCTLGQLQHSMTWAEFRQVGQQATAGDPTARQRYAAAVVACANQLPRSGG
jgi:hypothetical protein